MFMNTCVEEDEETNYGTLHCGSLLQNVVVYSIRSPSSAPSYLLQNSPQIHFALTLYIIGQCISVLFINTRKLFSTDIITREIQICQTSRDFSCKKGTFYSRKKTQLVLFIPPLTADNSLLLKGREGLQVINNCFSLKSCFRSGNICDVHVKCWQIVLLAFLH